MKPCVSLQPWALWGVLIFHALCWCFLASRWLCMHVRTDKVQSHVRCHNVSANVIRGFRAKFALIRVADHFANLAISSWWGTLSSWALRRLSEEPSGGEMQTLGLGWGLCSLWAPALSLLFHRHLSHAVKPICLCEVGDKKRWKGSKEILFSSLRLDVTLFPPFYLHFFVAQTVHWRNHISRAEGGGWIRQTAAERRDPIKGARVLY